MQGVICPLQLSLLRKTDVSLNRSCLSPRSRLLSSPWGTPPKGGFPHETLPPGRAGSLACRRSCGCGGSFHEPLKQLPRRKWSSYGALKLDSRNPGDVPHTGRWVVRHLPPFLRFKIATFSRLGKASPPPPAALPPLPGRASQQRKNGEGHRKSVTSVTGAKM